MLTHICPTRRWRIGLTLATLFASLAVTLAPVAGPARSQAAAATAAGFTPITPARVLDTRQVGQGPCITGPRTVVVGGRAVPAIAAAVTLNITVVTPSREGFATVWPAGSPLPLTSTVNYTAGQVVANNATVALGNLGALMVFGSEGCPHLLLDVTGWYAAPPAGSGGFTGLTPQRLLDTRQVGQGPCLTGSRVVQVTGRLAVPSGASAVALNVTVTDGVAPGYVTLWPSGQEAPFASTVNYTTRQTIANGTVVKLGSSGALTILASAGCPHIIIDVSGWYASLPVADTGATAALTPYRLLDTRQPSDREGCLRGYRAIQAAGRPGSQVPPDAQAVLVNLTVVDASVGGYLTAFEDLATPPPTSVLNYTAGQTVANAAWVPVNALNHRLTLFASGGCPHIIVDVLAAVTRSTLPPPPTGMVAGQAPIAPIWPVLADPAVLVDNGRYYLFGSNWGGFRAPVTSTTSLTAPISLASWSNSTKEAISGNPAWAANDGVFWAPHVMKLATGSYVMFFAANRPNPPQAWNPTCVGRAFASSPGGPYLPDSTPFTCGIDGTGGALDPELFRDPRTGSFTLLVAFGDTAVSINAIQLDDFLGAPLATREPSRLFTDSQALAGQQYGDTTFYENPSMVWDAAAGNYLLTFSFGDWHTANYRTGLARCSTPLGPCSLQSRTPWLTSGASRSGPGGLSFFRGLDGTTVYAISASYPSGAIGALRSGSVQRVTLASSPALAAP